MAAGTGAGYLGGSPTVCRSRPMLLRTVHRAGRAVYMRVDAVFLRVFGEALNPLYHLGAISYLMFWVVVASGFYVYAFYETGVDTTYASVERLTHAQWFAGGVM